MNQNKSMPVWLLFCIFCLSHATESSFAASLPAIVANLNMSTNKLQICSVAYFIGFASGTLVMGGVSDAIGRRKTMFLGIVMYVLMSCACGLLWSVELLIVARCLQAFGLSVCSVVGQVISRDVYKGSELSRIYSTVSIMLVMVPALSANVSNYIALYHNWRINMFLLSIFGVVLLAICFYFLPETSKVRLTRRTDQINAFMHIIRMKKMWSYAFVIGGLNGVMFGFYVEMPFIFLQYGHKDTISLFNIIVGMMVLVAAVVNKSMTERYCDSLKIIRAGLLINFLGCMLFTIGLMIADRIAPSTFIAIMVITRGISGVGQIISIPHCLRFGVEDAGKASGVAGAVFGFIYYVIIAIVSAFVSLMHDDHHFVKFGLYASNISCICLVILALKNKRSQST